MGDIESLLEGIGRVWGKRETERQREREGEEKREEGKRERAMFLI